jgi:hypothetical protein
MAFAVGGKKSRRSRKVKAAGSRKGGKPMFGGKKSKKSKSVKKAKKSKKSRKSRKH